MTRLLGRALVAAVLVASFSPMASPAATRSATLNSTTPSATWTESAPMSGAAPARRTAMCQSPTHPCDDFTLTVDRGSNTQTQVAIDLTPSAGAPMIITVFPPGCTPDVTTNCYVAYGQKAVLVNPANGTYVVRMVCDQACSGATYSAKATLGPFVVAIPAAGDQSFNWSRQTLKNGGTYGEPGIWINKLGHVIINTFGPTVWISTDDGKTFGDPLANVDPTPCSGLSGDADAVVADDDRYFADNLCLAGPTNLSYSSTNTGKTWDAGGPLPTLPGAATDSDRQWYALDPTNPAVVYFSYHDFEGPDIWVNKSTDHGQTWTQQVPITLGAPNFVDTGAGNTSARPLVDPSDPNNVLVFYTSNNAITSATAPPTNTDFDLNQVYLARSTDGGKTWTSSLIYNVGQTNGLDNTVAHEFSSAAIDSAGNAYVVVSERLGGHTETHIELLVVPKGSAAAAKPVQVDTSGLGANVFPWITAGDPGRIDVTWYGSPAADNNDTAAQWSEMFAQSIDALSATPHFAQSRVSGDKPMHAADICLAGTLCLVTGGDRDLSDFQTVAIDPCGMAEMVWTDDATGNGLTNVARQTGGASLRPTACGAGSVTGAGGSAAAAAGSGSGRLPATGGSTGATGPVGAGLVVLALALLRGCCEYHPAGRGGRSGWCR